VAVKILRFFSLISVYLFMEDTILIDCPDFGVHYIVRK